jgi:hypothetical protein
LRYDFSKFSNNIVYRFPGNLQVLLDANGDDHAQVQYNDATNKKGLKYCQTAHVLAKYVRMMMGAKAS